MLRMYDGEENSYATEALDCSRRRPQVLPVQPHPHPRRIPHCNSTGVEKEEGKAVVKDHAAAQGSPQGAIGDSTTAMHNGEQAAPVVDATLRGAMTRAAMEVQEGVCTTQEVAQVLFKRTTTPSAIVVMGRDDGVDRAIHRAHGTTTVAVLDRTLHSGAKCHRMEVQQACIWCLYSCQCTQPTRITAPTVRTWHHTMSCLAPRTLKPTLLVPPIRPRLPQTRLPLMLVLVPQQQMVRSHRGRRMLRNPMTLRMHNHRLQG